jgi:hypothetical protein
VLADKAYDADRIRELIQDQDATPNIPPKSNRRWKPCFSKASNDRSAKGEATGAAHIGIDGAVLAVSELLFLLFGLPFGDAIYNDHPSTLALPVYRYPVCHRWSHVAHDKK